MNAIITQAEFKDAYARWKGWTLAEYERRRVTFACNCGKVECQGWRAIPRPEAEAAGLLERGEPNRGVR